MKLNWHPFQRVGAAVVTALAGVDAPDQIHTEHLDQVAKTIVSDALAAARASRSGPGYAWWLALAACFPNSPPTHPVRGKWDDTHLTGRLEELFAPDQEDSPYLCFTCHAPTGTRWGKSRWPLACADGEINHVSPDLDGRRRGGIPVCRACRICLWAMPYGSIHNGHTVTTIDLDQDTALVEATQQLVTYNQAAIEQNAISWRQLWQRAPIPNRGFTGQVFIWRNDNRSPSLSIQAWQDAEQIGPTHEEEGAHKKVKDHLTATGHPG